MRFFLVLLIGMLVACGEATGHRGPPNIVILMLDTTRADRLTVNGYARNTTPALAKLAEESTVFLDAWSPSPWTGPSHASLFTGLRPEHHGYLLGTRYYLDKRFLTLAERLRGSGYSTICLTNNPMISHEVGLARGFDHYETTSDQRNPEKPLARWTVDRSIELAKRSRGPFLLFVNNWEPHLPYHPPEEFARRFLSRDVPDAHIRKALEFPPLPVDALLRSWRAPSDEQWSVLSDLYDAEIASLDAEIGRLVAGLRDTGILEDTVLIVLGDHGENLGEHGLAGHVFSVHRTLLQVPLMIRWPERFEKGARETAVVRLEDVFPTVLSLAGIAVPGGLDGVSLLANREGRLARALLGPHQFPNDPSEDPDFAPTDLWRGRMSVYDGRHHLIRTDRGREELYDVAADPLETKNLGPLEKETLDRLRPLLPEFP